MLNKLTESWLPTSSLYNTSEICAPCIFGNFPLLVSISVLWFQFLSTSVTFLVFLTHSASPPLAQLFILAAVAQASATLFSIWVFVIPVKSVTRWLTGPPPHRPTDRLTACRASQLTILAAFHSASSSHVWRKQYVSSLNVLWCSAHVFKVSRRCEVVCCRVEAAGVNDWSHTRGLL